MEVMQVTLQYSWGMEDGRRGNDGRVRQMEYVQCWEYIKQILIIFRGSGIYIATEKEKKNKHKMRTHI